eukprot:10900395-Ditylum_brightwellii.AAC.1
MHKQLAKKIAHAQKEHDKACQEKCHGKSELHHERCHGLGKCHAGKHKKNIVITMVFATMAQRSAASIKLAGSTFSLLTVSWNSRGSSRSGLLRMLRGVPRNAA